MKRKYKKLIVLSAFLVSLFTSGAFAFMTSSTEEIDNVVILGNVEIELIEPKWTDADDFDSDKIPNFAEAVYPNQIIDKDPAIENTGNNDAYVYLKVDIPKAAVKYVKENQEIVSPVQPVELFTYNANNGWVEFHKEDKGDYNSHYYYFKEPVKPNEKSDALFETIRFINVVEGQLEETKYLIDVTAYAAQISEYEAENQNLAAWNELAVQEGLPTCEGVYE